MLLGRHRIGLLAWCLAVVGYCPGAAILLLFLFTDGRDDHPTYGRLFSIGGVVLVMGVGAALAMRYWLPALRRIRRRRAMRRAGESLALSMLPSAPLGEFLSLPLFRFPARRRIESAFAMTGDLDGNPLMVFDQAFQGAWRDETGRRLWAREEQTVAAVEGAGPLADFHLGPADEWDELSPQWPVDLGLFRRRHFPELAGPISARDDATIDGLFTPARRADLAASGDYVIECSAGTLLVYRLDRRVCAEELAEFLRDVVRIVRAFRDVAGASPPPAHREASALETEPVPCPPRSLPRGGPVHWGEKLATCLVPLVLALLICGLILVAWASGASQPDGVAFSILLFIGAGATLLLFATKYDFGAAIRRQWRFWREARRLGLKPEPPSCDLADMPLFRLLHPDPVSASPRWLRGAVGGYDVRLLHLEHEVVFWPGTPRETAYLRGQTVALLPGLAAAARFRLGPADAWRDELFGAWPAAQGLTLRSDVGDVEVYANLDAGLCGLTPERIEALACFAGWVIEGAAGLVMVYRPHVRVTADDLARFLETVRRIASVLHDHPLSTAARPPSPSPDGIARPPDGVAAPPDVSQ